MITYLSNKIDSLFAQLILDKNINIETALQALIEECKKFNNLATVYLPLEGIVTSRAVQLGNIEIIPDSDSRFSEMINNAFKIIETTPHNDESKSDCRSLIMGVANSEFNGRAIAVYSTNAEHERAHERALIETRLAIDLLRIMSKYVYPLKRSPISFSVIYRQKSKKYFFPNPVNISSTSVSSAWASRALYAIHSYFILCHSFSMRLSSGL